RHLEGNFAVCMDARGDVDVHADIDVLKLRVDQRIDADAADARLKRSGRDRHAVANLERGLLAIQRADLWVLNDLGGSIVIKKIGSRGANGQSDIFAGVESFESTQLKGVAIRSAAARG